MAKFHGYVGFVDYVETAPSVWTEVASEKEYSGDLIRKRNHLASAAVINDNITINNEISIIADPYINQHFPSIRYVKWNKGVWKVTSVEDQYPRMILTLGDIYNGKQAEAG